MSPSEWYLWRVNAELDFQPMETVVVTVSDRIYQLLQTYASANDLSQSSIVETAVEAFLDIVERCDPDARAIARKLSVTDE